MFKIHRREKDKRQNKMRTNVDAEDEVKSVSHSIMDSHNYGYAKHLYIMHALTTFLYTAEPCQMDQTVDFLSSKQRNKINVDDFGLVPLLLAVGSCHCRFS